jgi:hypothetical protein
VDRAVSGGPRRQARRRRRRLADRFAVRRARAGRRGRGLHDARGHRQRLRQRGRRVRARVPRVSQHDARDRGRERRDLRPADRRRGAEDARSPPQRAGLPVPGHDRHARPVDRAQAVDRRVLAGAVRRTVQALRHGEGPRVPAGLDGLSPDPAARGHRASARDLRLGDQLPRRAARPARQAAAVVGDLGSDDADPHRGSRRGAVRGPALRSRRLAARLAGPRAAADPRSGAVPRGHDRRRGGGGGRYHAHGARRARRRDPGVDAGGVARAARAERRAGLAAPVVCVAVRVRARDAARPLEGARRRSRRGGDRRHGRGPRRDHEPRSDASDRASDADRQPRAVPRSPHAVAQGRLGRGEHRHGEVSTP